MSNARTNTKNRPESSVGVSWSFSRLMDFESCPLMYKFRHIDRLPAPQNPAAERGTRIHAEAEALVRGQPRQTEKEFDAFGNELDRLAELYREGRVSCEEEWAFDANWEPTDWKRGWLRLKADAVILDTDSHTIIVDYKTGKRAGNEIKHGRQLQLYALCAMILNPELQSVTAELWYLDCDELTSFSVTTKQFQPLLKTWDKAGRAVTSAKNFPAKPSYRCNWCPYRKECENRVPENMKGRLL